MKKKIYLIIALLGVGIAIKAQTFTLEGYVFDASDSEPLIGATVLHLKSGNGSIADVDGSFTLSNVEVGDSLKVSYVGYKTKKVKVKSASGINISLQLDNSILDETVVIGYGTQKRSAITGSISSVKPEEITQTPVLRVEQAIQGRVSGVQITNQSGQPGDAPTITIRGIGTNGNANPIYIVDGVQVNAIDYLNPDDIKSIDILKDAASTAIYGARGANGVVLITTKAGGQTGKPTASYSAYYGVQNPWRVVDMMSASEYANVINEGAINSGRTPLYEEPDTFGTGTDWQRALYNFNAPITNHSVAFADNSESSSYTVGLSYFAQEGIVGGDKSQFERYTARLNMRHDFGERFTMGENFSWAQIDRSAVQANQEFGGLVSNALNLDPITPVYMTDPSVINDTTSEYRLNPAVRTQDGRYYGISEIIAQEVVNPLARLEVTHGGSNESKFVGNAFAQYELADGLVAKTVFGLELSNVSSNGFAPTYYLNSAQANVEPIVNQFYGKTTIWNSENTLNYRKKIGLHNFDALLGATVRETKYQWMSGSKSGLVVTDPEIVNLGFAADNLSAQLFGGLVENALVSNFARLIYDYDGKYLVTLTTRRDGSTKFGPDNRFGVFPSISTGWVLSKESFLENSEAISFLKLRASWGQNGNDQISDYAWVATIASDRNYTFTDENGIDTLVVGSSPSQVVDPSLRWEASEQLDIGFDLTLWDDKLTINADFFRKETKGLLIRKPVPGVAGNIAGESNVGGVLNTGVELAVNYRKAFQNSFLTIGGNATYLRNRVLTVDGAEGVITGASYSTYGVVSRMEAGFPIGYFYGFQTDGVFQNEREIFSHINNEGDVLQPRAEPGDVRFVDVNEDGVIDDEDRTIIGSPHPDIIYGFNASYEHKKFEARFLFFGMFGNEVFNGIRRMDLTESNFPAYFEDRWTGEGTSDNPRFVLTDGNQNYSRISDVYLEDGSFLRLRNLTIGYNIRGNKTKAFKNIYLYIAGDNLLTFTGYRGLEPEIGARNGWVLDMGIDRGIYPQARVYRFGIDVKF